MLKSELAFSITRSREVNGMGSSDEEDDEEDDIRWWLWCSRWSVGKDEDDAAAYKAALGQVGHCTQDSQDSMESQDRTVE
jgi:hypothetical protein